MEKLKKIFWIFVLVALLISIIYLLIKVINLNRHIDDRDYVIENIINDNKIKKDSLAIFYAISDSLNNHILMLQKEIDDKKIKILNINSKYEEVVRNIRCLPIDGQLQFLAREINEFNERNNKSPSFFIR